MAIGWNTRVLIVDAHRLAAEAIAAVLQTASGMEVIGIVSDPSLAVTHAVELSPDVIMVHEPVADEPAAAVIRSLRAAVPSARVLVVSARVDAIRLDSWIHAGASGCVVEDTSTAALIRSVELAHAGEETFPRRVAVESKTSGRRPVGQASASENKRPTVRELEVLQTLATVWSIEEAAERLVVSPHTVRMHMKRVMSKLGARSRLEAVIRALQAGLISLPGSGPSARDAAADTS
jgi:DNA-binding NarL/FixJ family response regulator